MVKAKRMREDREREEGRERAAVKLGFIDFVLWHAVGGWLSLGISFSSSFDACSYEETTKVDKG